jgi:DNA-binding ferritin-like protein
MSKQNYFEEVNHFISESIQMLNKLQYLHWNTVSYAFHIATEKAYNDWKNLLDNFVEKYIGSHLERKKNILLAPTRHNITRESLLNDDITYMIESIESLKQNIKPTSLINILDDFQNALFQLSYLLTLE